MKKHFIITGTVTYATRGRNVLQRHGFTAHIERTGARIPNKGCGYGIVISGDPDAAVAILKAEGLKVLGVVKHESIS